MCLSDVKRGQWVNIDSIDDLVLRTQLLRFGITEGSSLECLEKIPFGPFMIRHNRQELAIGRDFAEKILVKESPA